MPVHLSVCKSIDAQNLSQIQANSRSRWNGSVPEHEPPSHVLKRPNQIIPRHLLNAMHWQGLTAGYVTAKNINVRQEAHLLSL